MKTPLILSCLIVPFVLLWIAQGGGEEKSKITVTGNELNNGVVILEVVKAGKTYELQCNDGTSNCTALKNGRYQMLELPKNFGMYDCKDVEVYKDSAPSDSAPSAGKGAKIGEYCLTEK